MAASGTRSRRRAPALSRNFYSPHKGAGVPSLRSQRRPAAGMALPGSKWQPAAAAGGGGGRAGEGGGGGGEAGGGESGKAGARSQASPGLEPGAGRPPCIPPSTRWVPLLPHSLSSSISSARLAGIDVIYLSIYLGICQGISWV